MKELVIILISVGILIDIFLCALTIRRRRKGYGSSGLPIVLLIIFYLLPLLFYGKSVITNSVFIDGLLLIFFHIVVVFLALTIRS